MRKADIKIGDVLYYGPGSGYEERDGNGQGKATVLMLAVTGGDRTLWRTLAPQFRELTPDHPGYVKAPLLVQLESGEKRAVGAITLRGPYEEVAARVEARRSAIAERKAAERNEDLRKRGEAMHLAALLRAALDLPAPSLTQPTGIRVGYGESLITIDRQTARLILDRLEACD